MHLLVQELAADAPLPVPVTVTCWCSAYPPAPHISGPGLPPDAELTERLPGQRLSDARTATRILSSGTASFDVIPTLREVDAAGA